MANGKIRFGKQLGGELSLIIPDGVDNTEVIVPESGTLTTKEYVDSEIVKLTKNQTIPETNTSSSNIAGNAGTATKLQTARTINGVSFDGSANIVAPTNLGITDGTTAGPIVTSSSGTNATLPTASATASGVVTTGAQTFAGVKTFTSSPIVPTPTANTQAANKAYVDSKTSSGGYTQSLNNPGWTKLPNGLIIQWGTDRDYDSSSGGSRTINFPIAFPNACFLVNGNTQTNYSGSAAPLFHAISSWDKTSFIRPHFLGRMAWIAIGY